MHSRTWRGTVRIKRALGANWSWRRLLWHWMSSRAGRRMLRVVGSCCCVAIWIPSLKRKEPFWTSKTQILLLLLLLYCYCYCLRLAFQSTSAFAEVFHSKIIDEAVVQFSRMDDLYIYLLLNHWATHLRSIQQTVEYNRKAGRQVFFISIVKRLHVGSSTGSIPSILNYKSFQEFWRVKSS